MATCSAFNDPWEGASLVLYPSVAGASIARASEQRHPIVEDALNRYRILSLAGTMDSPPMWAHYCDNHTGVCLVFKNRGSFDDANPIKYSCRHIDVEREFPEAKNETDDLMRACAKALMRKDPLWGYEKEHRILRESDEEGNKGVAYFHFCPRELEAVVFASQCSEEMADQIAHLVPKDVRLLDAYPAFGESRMIFMPHGCPLAYDGTSWRNQQREVFNGDVP